MSASVVAEHGIVVPLPVDRCQMLFTPAGEELWADGWSPEYLRPPDGRTTEGMVFVTRSGTETTVWFLTEFSQDPHRARYVRVCPDTRWGYVEVECTARGISSTDVRVRYTMHAVSAAGEELLEAFAPDAFAAMIDGWRCRIEERLDELREASIR